MPVPFGNPELTEVNLESGTKMAACVSKLTMRSTNSDIDR